MAQYNDLFGFDRFARAQNIARGWDREREQDAMRREQMMMQQEGQRYQNALAQLQMQREGETQNALRLGIENQPYLETLRSDPALYNEAQAVNRQDMLRYNPRADVSKVAAYGDRMEAPKSALTGDAANLEMVLGRKPTLVELSDYRGKGASQVNVGGATQEKEFEKTYGKQQAERYGDIQKFGQQAFQSSGKYDRLGQLLQLSGTSKMRPTTKAIAEVAGGFGWNIDPNLPYAQAAELISNQMALELRNPAGGAGMPGAMSDKDREFLVKMIPSIQNDPASIPIMIDYLKKVNQRALDVAKLAREYKRNNKGKFDEGFDDYLSAWAAKNPLFTDAETAPQGQAQIKVGTIEDGYRYKGGDISKPSSWEAVQ